MMAFDTEAGGGKSAPMYGLEKRSLTHVKVRAPGRLLK